MLPSVDSFHMFATAIYGLVFISQIHTSVPDGSVDCEPPVCLHLIIVCLFAGWLCYLFTAGLPNGVHGADRWGPQKNDELHIHNEGIDSKCILNVTS